MCIGLPLQVVSVAPGHAVCRGRGETRRVRTALVGDVAIGDWLLVFIDSAQERLEPGRAREIGATLDLLQRASQGHADAIAPFELPSTWTDSELRALAGAPIPTAHESTAP